jgi:hypothetical protein
MRDSIFPDDRMVFAGSVTGTATDPAGCAWVDLDITVSVINEDDGDRLCCTCTARVAVPATENDNPWARKGDDWTP